jgi:hypothetical protein
MWLLLDNPLRNRLRILAPVELRVRVGFVGLEVDCGFEPPPMRELNIRRAVAVPAMDTIVIEAVLMVRCGAGPQKDSIRGATKAAALRRDRIRDRGGIVREERRRQPCGRLAFSAMRCGRGGGLLRSVEVIALLKEWAL